MRRFRWSFLLASQHLTFALFAHHFFNVDGAGVLWPHFLNLIHLALHSDLTLVLHQLAHWNGHLEVDLSSLGSLLFVVDECQQHGLVLQGVEQQPPLIDRVFQASYWALRPRVYPIKLGVDREPNYGVGEEFPSSSSRETLR